MYGLPNAVLKPARNFAAMPFRKRSAAARHKVGLTLVSKPVSVDSKGSRWSIVWNPHGQLLRIQDAQNQNAIKLN